MTLTTKPILVSHQGKLAWLQPDGSLTTFQDGMGLIARKPDKLPPLPVKRWHDPYA